jgi:hypothetical protein
MHIPGWLFPRRQTPERRLLRVLRAAARDPFYRGLVFPVPTPVLDQFPFADIADWTKNRLLPDIPATLVHPLNRNVFAARPAAGRAQYPAIAATRLALLDRAREFARCRPQVEFAVLVVARPGDAELSEPERDQLWEAFQVPIYRLLVGYDGAVLAHECEALCGLHCSADAIFEEFRGSVYVTSLTDLRYPSVRLRTRISGRLEEGPCDCGRPGLRLAPVWLSQEEVSSAAD